MDYVDCLTPIVGLSETKCECHDIPQELANTSLIDRFLDDEMYSVPLSFTNTKIDCDSGGIWDVLQKSRRKGISLFAGLISRAIEEGRESVNSIYNGSAGREKYTSALPAKGYYELVIDPRRYRSTQMRIDTIDFYMSSSGSMDVEFVNLNTGDVIHSESLTISSIYHYVPSSPVVLPMSDEFGRKIRWSIRISGLTPMNNTIYCNCPGKDLHKKYFMLYGRSGDSVGDLETSTKLIYSAGMMLGFDYSCNYDWICNEYDYQTGFGRTLAETVFLCCVVELLTFILNRSTPLTPAPPEYIMDKKNTAMEIIDNNITWIINNVPRNVSDCIGCKKSGIKKGEILI